MILLFFSLFQLLCHQLLLLAQLVSTDYHTQNTNTKTEYKLCMALETNDVLLHRVLNWYTQYLPLN